MTIFRRFPKILQNLSEGRPNVAEHFPKISEYYQRLPKIAEDCRRLPKIAEDCRRLPEIAGDCRRLPKTSEEDPKIFRSYSNKFKYNLRDKLDITESIDILTNEDKENTPLESRMWFRMNFTSGVFPVKHSCLYNKTSSVFLYWAIDLKKT